MQATRTTSTVLPLQSLKTRITLATLTIFLVSLWSLSYYASRMLHQDMENLLGEQQFSTVSVVANAIDEDLEEQIRELEHAAGAMDSAWLKDPAVLQGAMARQIMLQNHFNAGVQVVGRDGVVIAEVPQTGRPGTNYANNEAVHSVLSKGATTVGQPVMGPLLQQPVFPIVTAILDAKGEVSGALIGTTTLGQPNFLDKITANRYGRSGGYFLLAPQSRQVISANDQNRFMEALPAPGINPSLDRFMQGYQGSDIAANLFGVEVLASAKLIPAAGWVVLASLPTAEAFAPLHNMLQRMLLATLCLTLLAGVSTWWLLRRQLAPLLAAARSLATLSDTQQPPQPLPIARADEIGQLIGGFNRLLETLAQREQDLKQSERKLSTILDNVDAYIYLKDPQSRYLFANRPMREAFGLTLEDVVGQRDENFVDPDSVAQLRQHDRLALEEGKIFKSEETVTRLTDGRTSTYLSVKIPLYNDAGDIYALCGLSTNITKRKRLESELRIAAVAFECREGIVVMDADLRILRVNQAFTLITGYTQAEVQGQTIAILGSERYPASFYEAAWHEAKRNGAWKGEMWHRCKNGDDFPDQVTMTAVHDDQGQLTHYVVNLVDASDNRRQEQQRLLNEAAHRNLLVREVHHRIKNNLQGITGLLRQFAQKHPETADTIHQAIGQVQGISVIHGLQGRAVTSSVRLCELTRAIADEVQNLWQAPVTLDLPPGWRPCVIAEKEAVPIALVLNELILNAVKHGGKAHGKVSISLRKGPQPDTVQVRIVNAGLFSSDSWQIGGHRSGLRLIASLMPPQGALIAREQQGDLVTTVLELAPPVIFPNSKDPT